MNFEEAKEKLKTITSDFCDIRYEVTIFEDRTEQERFELYVSGWDWIASNTSWENAFELLKKEMKKEGNFPERSCTDDLPF